MADKEDIETTDLSLKEAKKKVRQLAYPLPELNGPGRPLRPLEYKHPPEISLLEYSYS